MRTIADFAPEDVEAGVGLALQDNDGRYLFGLAGLRDHCSPGELFYASIGGHREKGEGWLTCARREAREEIGTAIEILPAATKWYIPHHDAIRQVEILEHPHPLALYEMVYPSGTDRAGNLYRIVIYKARLFEKPEHLLHDELQGIIALTARQVIWGLERKPTLAELIDEGATIIAGCQTVDRKTYLYPIGTALALARLLPPLKD